MIRAQTVVGVYELAKIDATVKAQYYSAAAAKQFEERRFELSNLNARRANRWWKVAVEMQLVLDGLHGDWLPW